MFDIYIKNFNRNGNLIQTETLIQTIPAASEGGLRLISPVIKNEMGNAESFDFSIEPGTPFYDAFLQMKTMIRVEYDGDNIFFGRVLTVENNRFSGARKIRCEGAISLLMDSPVKGVKEASRSKISTYTYISNLISSHNDYLGEDDKYFVVGQVPGNYYGVNSDQKLDEDTRKFGSDSWTDTKSALEDLRSHFGGYFRTRTSRIGHGIYLDWLDNYFNPTTNAQKIQVSKNLLDISDITEVDNIFTVLVPLGTYQSSSSSNDGSSYSSSSSNTDNTMYIDGTYLPVPDILSEFSYPELNRGYHRAEDYANSIRRYGAIFKTVQFSNATSKSDLREKACEWIKDNYYGEVIKYTIKAVDMRQIGNNTTKIMVGDLVELVYPVIKEDGTNSRESKIRTCMSVSYDLYHPENNSYTFGIPANILTSMYGISNTSSVSSNSTSASDNGGESDDSVSNAWELIRNWLMAHMLNYDSESAWGKQHYPWTTDLDGTQEEYNHMSGDRFYSHNHYIYRFSYSLDNTYDSRLYKQILSQDGAASALDYKKDHYVWSYAKDTSVKTITEDNYITILEDYNIREYVLIEYGFDLLSWANVTGWIESGENVVFAQKIFEGVSEGAFSIVRLLATGTSIVNSMSQAVSTSFLNFLNYLDDPLSTKDTGQPSSWVDNDGTLHWFYEDPNSPGTYVETTNRSLNLMAVNDDNFIGTMVTQDYADADGNIHIYKFGQGIEDWAGGKMVVANVDGDVIKIGSERTNWATTVARKINGTFLDPITFIVNNSDPSKPDTILVGTAGQVSYKARYDETLGAYVYDENGDVTLTGDGFWNTKNLAIEGGVYTVRENNRYVSYVKSSQLIIGDQNTSTTILQTLLDSGVIDSDEYEPQSLVTSAVYTENLYADRARISTIESDYLKTRNLKASIASIALLNVQDIATTSAQGQANFSSYYGNHFYLNVPGGGGSVTYKDLKDNIDYAYFTTSGATTTIHLHKASGSEVDPSDLSLPTGGSLTFKNYTGGWDAAVGKLTIPTTTVTNNNTILIKYPPSTVDGAAASISYYLGNTSGDNNKVDLLTSVNGSEVTVARYSHGKYNAGWNAAVGKLTIPTSTVTNNNAILVKYPPSTVDGAAASRSYYINNTSGNNNAVDLLTSVNGSEVTVARYSHGKYNAGWNSAVGKLTIPTSTVTNNNTIVVKYPPSTVDGAATSRSYYISNTSGNNNAVDLITAVNGSNITVARYSHGKYNAGWNAAVGELTIPTSTVTNNNTIVVKYPPSTVDGSATSRSYYMSNTSGDNNKVDLITAVNGSNITVARYSHGKYNAGWNAAVGKLTIPTSTVTNFQIILYK